MGKLDSLVELTERVKLGATFMDDFVPDWYTKIDMDKLDMSCPGKCIFGQLFGSFAQGLSKLPINYSMLWAYDNGLSDYATERYAVLSELWKSEILARLREDTLNHYDD